MKKTILFLTVSILAMTGCSKTWSGIKQDTHEVIDDTREVIHEATAPDIVPTNQNLKPLPIMDTPAVSDTEVVSPISQ